MSWVKLSDDIHLNEKVLSVGPAARWLYVAATAHSRNQGLGGRLTASTLRSLVAGQGVSPSAINALAKAGLFEMTEGGEVAIHDYEEYNPPSSKERVRKHRRGKKGLDVTVTVTPGNDSGNGISNPSVTPCLARDGIAPVPVPVPIYPPDPPGGGLLAEENSEPDPADPLIAVVMDVLNRPRGLSAIDVELIRTWLWTLGQFGSGGGHLTLTEIAEDIRRQAASAADRGERIRSARYFEPGLKALNAAKVDGQLNDLAGRTQQLPPGQGYEAPADAEDAVDEPEPAPPVYVAPVAGTAPGMRRLADLLPAHLKAEPSPTRPEVLH